MPRLSRLRGSLSARANVPPDPHASGASSYQSAARRSAEYEAARRRLLGVQDAEDAESMRAFQDGDPDAFESIARRHEKALYNFCLRMLGTRAAAEDGTQEILLRMVRAASRFRPETTVRAWMYAIARNHCIDELRKAQLRETESLDRPLTTEEDPQPLTLQDRVADDRSLRPDRGAESARMRGVLIRALSSLPPEQREVFLMREQAGLGFKELSSIIGIPENTAKSRMRYALQALRSFLEREGVTRADAQP